MDEVILCDGVPTYQPGPCRLLISIPNLYLLDGRIPLTLYRNCVNKCCLERKNVFLTWQDHTLMNSAAVVVWQDLYRIQPGNTPAQWRQGSWPPPSGFLGEGESVFFRSLVPGRLTMLHWMALCPWVYGQHKLESHGWKDGWLSS